MKNKALKVGAALLISLVMAACQQPGQSSTSPSVEPSSSAQPSQTSEPSSQPSSSVQPSSSTPAEDPEMAVTALDVISESNKVYLKVSGTISGYANADAMKMAVGLLDALPAEGTEAEWLLGSETPADADYKYAPTVNNGAFELKFDVSVITTVKAGVFTIYVGPKGAYAAVPATVTMGTGKCIQSGYRWYIRSDKGALAMDELPPLELTESFVKVEGTGENAAVYHYIGGALNTTKLPEADFLAKHPYVQYEQCVSWKTNVMGSATKTDLVTTVVDNGKAYIKTNITSLPNETYNIKFNLAEDKDADIKMDAVIDMRDESDQVIFNDHAYAVYADSSKTAKDDIYGNCGLFISHAHKWERGQQVANSELYNLTCGTTNHVGYELDLNATNTPNLGNENKMNNKKVSTFNITGIASGEYNVYLKAHISSGNEGPEKQVGLSYGEQLDDNGSSAGGNAVPGRYSLQAGANGDLIYCQTGQKNFNKVGYDDPTAFKWSNCSIFQGLMIKGDEGTLKFAHTGAGYSLYVESVRLVRVGNYMKPATPVVFTNGVMRIEAEDYHEASSEPTTATEGGATFISHMTSGWPQFNASYKISLSEAKHVKIKLHYAWYAGQWGMNGACELRLDGSDSKIKDATGTDNLGQADANMTGEWLDAETNAFDLAAGEHTFKLTIPGGCEISWDYIEIIEVPAN